MYPVFVAAYVKNDIKKTSYVLITILMIWLLCFQVTAADGNWTHWSIGLDFSLLSFVFPLFFIQICPFLLSWNRESSQLSIYSPNDTNKMARNSPSENLNGDGWATKDFNLLVLLLYFEIPQVGSDQWSSAVIIADVLDHLYYVHLFCW